MPVVCRQWAVLTDIIYFELRNRRISTKASRHWRDSFNRAHRRFVADDDPVYCDDVYKMLQDTVDGYHLRSVLEDRLTVLVFRILFAYIRPEL